MRTEMNSKSNVVTGLPLKVSELFRPQRFMDMELQFTKEDFDLNISLESEQRILDLTKQLKDQKELNKEQRKKASSVFKVSKVVEEYKALLSEANLPPIEIPVPESEEDKKALVQNLELEIQQLKEEKKMREAKDEENLKKAQQLAKELYETGYREKPKVAIPPNPNKTTLNLIDMIKDIYGTTIEYEAANVLLNMAKGDLALAVDMYTNQCTINVKFVYGSVSFTEKLNLMQRGDELLSYLFTRLRADEGKEVVIQLGSEKAELLGGNAIRAKTLSDLGLKDGSTVYVSLVFSD